ncbi:hypothetical protein SAMN05428966_101118 [Massilia sp. PDC64]|nr:hypothetical protein [Massilia sp. PDC64]SDC11612.1 hypothetical protein SAMN05428966_101118 [Massilia sp. PDC64]
MISFKQAATLADIEDAAGLLKTGIEVSVRVPTTLRHGGGFGISVALIQFFATWVRSTNSKPLLKLHSSAAASNGIAHLAQEPHGMAALYFAPAIENSVHEIIATKEGLAYAIPRIHAMQSGDYLQTMHGRGVFLACFSGASNEYLLPFYSNSNNGTLRGREDFSRLTEQIMRACAPNALRKLGSKHMPSVSSLLYELFRNTDEHARTDEQGNRYHRNMRGLIAKYISYSADSLSSVNTSDNVPQNLFLLRTLANQALHKDTKGVQRATADLAFLEITIFDTGPGLVKRWLAKNSPNTKIDDIDISEEVQYVQQCFEQHATTKDSSVSGHGLSLVLSSLKDLKAFLRLRTGRVCLIQDFSSSTTTSKFHPKHWLKDRNALPYVAGAAYSIIIPLSRGEA